MPLVARSATRDDTLWAALLAVERSSMRSFSAAARRLLMSLPHAWDGVGRLCFMTLVYQYDERHLAILIISSYSYLCQQGHNKERNPHDT